MPPTTRKNILTNMAWRFAERSGAQLVTFIVSIILARLLSPDEYGTIALVTVFTTILQVFVDSGFGVALIQKKDADDLDFSTVFYFNLAICIVLYVGMFFAAPAIASFYEKPELTSVIRALSFTLVISGIKNVQQAFVSRNLIFRKFFFATFTGTVLAAIIGVTMVYMGYGIWALVVQQLTNAAVGTIILWIAVKWRPKLAFSWKSLTGLFAYGWKLLVSSLLVAIYNNIRQLVIGKMYTTEDLAFYNKGNLYPAAIVSNISTSIDSVLLPTMAAAQDDTERLKAMTKRAIGISSYIMWPAMIGFCVCAEPLVRLLLTDKWLPCVPFLQIFCINYALFPIQTANLNAIKALGRSDIFLKLEIIKRIVGIVALAATVWFGPLAMAYSLLFATVIETLLNAYPNSKLLNYRPAEQIKDIIPPMLVAVAMGGIVYCVELLGLNDILTLVIQVPLGIALYVLGSKLFHLEGFEYVLGLIKTARNSKKMD